MSSLFSTRPLFGTINRSGWDFFRAENVAFAFAFYRHHWFFLGAHVLHSTILPLLYSFLGSKIWSPLVICVSHLITFLHLREHLYEWNPIIFYNTYTIPVLTITIGIILLTKLASSDRLQAAIYDWLCDECVLKATHTHSDLSKGKPRNVSARSSWIWLWWRSLVSKDKHELLVRCLLVISAGCKMSSFIRKNSHLLKLFAALETGQGLD